MLQIEQGRGDDGEEGGSQKQLYVTLIFEIKMKEQTKL